MQNKTFDDFNKEASEYKAILTRYSKTGEVFVDKNFHPNKSIYEKKVQFNEKDHKWIRIDQFFKAPLFKPELINPDYIKQGDLGDCYLLGALSRIAKQPDLVPSLFDRSADVILSKEQDSINIKCGAVVIYFHVFGRRTPVLIDTLIPFKRGTRTPRFSHPSDIKYSPWFCLVEKAFAKLQGSFSDIIGGTLPQAVYSLYGYFPMNMKMKDLQTGGKPVFDKIMKYQSKGAVMGAAIHLESLKQEITTDELLDKGLVTGHAYLVIKARKCDNKNFFCLRNPWGDHEWLGDWSDTSDLWTPELKQSLGMEQADNGTFWMIDNDFFKYFTEFQIAKPIPPEWHSRSYFVQLIPGDHDGFHPENSRAACDQRKNFAFQLTEPLKPGEKCRMYILIEKRRKLFNEETLTTIKSPSYSIMIAKSNGRKLSRDVILRSNRYTLNSESALLGFNYEITSHKDLFTIVLQRTQKCNIVEDCYVQLFCKYDFNLYDIDKPTCVVPEDDMFGIIFDNFSVRHKNVARPLKKKLIKQKEIFTFTTNDENVSNNNEVITTTVSHIENDSKTTTNSNTDEIKETNNNTQGNNDSPGLNNEINPNSSLPNTPKDAKIQSSITKKVSFGGIVNPVNNNDDAVKSPKPKKLSDEFKPILFGKTEAQVEYEQAFSDWQQMMDNLLNEQKNIHVKFSIDLANSDKIKMDINNSMPEKMDSKTSKIQNSNTMKNEKVENATSKTIDSTESTLRNHQGEIEKEQTDQFLSHNIVSSESSSDQNQNENEKVKKNQTTSNLITSTESILAHDQNLNENLKNDQTSSKQITVDSILIPKNEKKKNDQTPSSAITVESVLVNKKEINIIPTPNSNETENTISNKTNIEINQKPSANNFNGKIKSNQGNMPRPMKQIKQDQNSKSPYVDEEISSQQERPKSTIKAKAQLNESNKDKENENVLNNSNSPTKLKIKSQVKKTTSRLDEKTRSSSSKSKQPCSPIKEPQLSRHMKEPNSPMKEPQSPRHMKEPNSPMREPQSTRHMKEPNSPLIEPQSPRRMKEPNSPLKELQSTRRMKEPNSPLIHLKTESSTKKTKTHLFKRNENKPKNKA